MVKWSLRARDDLKAIHDRVAKDAPLNAKRVVREIIQAASNIAQTPRGGRVVPELRDADIREIPVHSWRVIYQILGDDLFVLTLLHKRRDAKSAALKTL